MSDANRQASDFVSRMQSQNWAQQMQNQLGAYNQLGALQGMQNQALQGGLSMAPQAGQYGMNLPWANLQQYASLVGRPTALGGGSTLQGGIGSAFGSGGAIPGMLGILSDRRLKKNIKRIGTTAGGTPIYQFNYLWSDEPSIGVMADEVPEARIMTDSGYYAVDYTRVT